MFVHCYLQMKKWKSLLYEEYSFITEKVIIYHLWGGVEGFYFVGGEHMVFRGKGRDQSRLKELKVGQ